MKVRGTRDRNQDRRRRAVADAIDRLTEFRLDQLERNGDVKNNLVGLWAESGKQDREIARMGTLLDVVVDAVAAPKRRDRRAAMRRLRNYLKERTT